MVYFFTVKKKQHLDVWTSIMMSSLSSKRHSAVITLQRVMQKVKVYGWLYKTFHFNQWAMIYSPFSWKCSFPKPRSFSFHTNFTHIRCCQSLKATVTFFSVSYKLLVKVLLFCVHMVEHWLSRHFTPGKPYRADKWIKFEAWILF